MKLFFTLRQKKKMPIKSYIAYPVDGKRNELIMKIKALDSCELNLAINEEIFIVVTDTFSEDEDKMIYETIVNMPELKHLTLVSGFSDEEISN